jgi:hypothetical protein
MFQVWGYSVSLSRLLLRSTKSESATSRIDVFFQNVKAMDVTTTMRGLVVMSAEPVDVDRIRVETGLAPDEDSTFYVLFSEGRRGYVVAGLMAESVDDLEFYEVSKYWDAQGGKGLPHLDSNQEPIG